MSTAAGRTVRLFLVDGSPTGVVTAEVMNWTGQVLTTSRTDLAAALGREQAKRPGVYLLVGESGEAGLPDLYIGESDNVAGRIKTHDASREFDRTCIITSKDANLTKSHTLYLESRLIEMVAASGRARVVNGRASDVRSLPEPDRADMEYFLLQLGIILPVIAFDFLRPARVVRPSAELVQPIKEPQGDLALILSPRDHPELARAVETGGEVTVLARSKAVKQEYTTNHYAGLRQQLLDDGRLVQSTDEPDYLVFAQDVPFKSPSAAAAVVLNRNSNGRLEWRLDDGTSRTLKDFQDAQLAAVDVSDETS